MDSVVFREDLYPRIETSPGTVQKYASDLDVLPPIEVNQHNEIIDGWHRWTAHRKVGSETISVTVTQTRSDVHLLELAITRNSTHGLQLSNRDKQSMCVRIYNADPTAATQERLAGVLSVSPRTVSRWLSRTKKDRRSERDAKIFDLWLACHTQEEIAERLGLVRESVAKVLVKLANWQKLPKPKQHAADFEDDFKPPLYNVWKEQNKANRSSHPGNTHSTWVENLLWLYTDPFDVVCDPFAGGGSTIDVCKKRFRRYYVSDLTPIVERESEIRQSNIKDGPPKPHSFCFQGPPNESGDGLGSGGERRSGDYPNLCGTQTDQGEPICPEPSMFPRSPAECCESRSVPLEHRSF